MILKQKAEPEAVIKKLKEQFIGFLQNMLLMLKLDYMIDYLIILNPDEDKDKDFKSNLLILIH